MRKRFANRAKGCKNEYQQKRVDEEDFNGYVCHVKMKEVEKPLLVNDSGQVYCLLDTNYEWLRIYPDNEKYAITVMYDDKRNVVEWYFDITKSNGIENGIPYIDDLYLDVVIGPDGRVLILDEDELQEALNKGEISQEDFDLAYETANEIKNKYGNNLDKLKKLTDKMWQQLSSELTYLEQDELEK